jgi:hypothetical protein
MSELLQFIIVAAFGALCFGCGYLIAFVVARNRWRDEMIKRGVARYNWQTGKWDWGAERIEILNAQLPLFHRLGLSRNKTSEFVARSPLRLGRREEAYFARQGGPCSRS